jgi:hypothetical protein
MAATTNIQKNGEPHRLAFELVRHQLCAELVDRKNFSGLIDQPTFYAAVATVRTLLPDSYSILRGSIQLAALDQYLKTAEWSGFLDDTYNASMLFKQQQGLSFIRVTEKYGSRLVGLRIVRSTDHCERFVVFPGPFYPTSMSSRLIGLLGIRVATPTLAMWDHVATRVCLCLYRCRGWRQSV